MVVGFGVGIVDKVTCKLSAVPGYSGTKPEKGELDLHKSSISFIVLRRFPVWNISFCWLI